MSLRVIGAGFARTGTHSLKLALEQLLGQPCYHMWELLAQPEHVPVWTAAARGKLPNWGDLLQEYGATVDFPPAAFWPELMEAYPEALVLLSVRDTEAWWQSCDHPVCQRNRCDGRRGRCRNLVQHQPGCLGADQRPAESRRRYGRALHHDDPRRF